MKCTYCASPVVREGTNCKNCGGPLPELPVIDVLDIAVSMQRSMMEVTTHNDSSQHFIGGLSRARMTLEIDPKQAHRLLNSMPAFIRWPGGSSPNDVARDHRR